MTLDEAIKHAEEVADKKEREKQKWERWLEHDNDHRAVAEKVSCELCAKEHRQLAEWLKELKQLREQTRWIPVSERLPEDKQAVLVWCPQYKNIYCAYLEKERWWIFGAFVQTVSNEVVAWRPLPEPYKSEVDE